MLEMTKRLVPRSLKDRAREWIRKTARIRGWSPIVSNLYEPWESDPDAHYYFQDPNGLSQERPLDGFPVPPAHMRMGYATESDASYLEAGRNSAASLRSIMEDHGITLREGDSAMDWGCATGRVLQFFAPDTERVEFWGVDQDAKSIAWNKQNLAPPFHFMTCSALPHLPFEDGKFSFIYALSVFTHIEDLQDLWLMEMNRILKPGGYAVFTIHDEHTIEWLRETGERPGWLPEDVGLDELLAHEVTIIRGGSWGWTCAVFRSDWIRKHWGHYFEVCEIRPQAEWYQTAVVLRKRS